MSPIIPESMFDRFSVETVRTPQALAESMRVRFEVYCQEMGFEHADAFPDGKERNQYDHRASHVVVTHRATGLTAGSVRIITSSSPGLEGLPISDHAVIDHGCLRDTRHRFCEVSRLAVRPLFRRHGAVPPEVACLGPAFCADWEDDRDLFSHIGAMLSFAAIAGWCHGGADIMLILSRPALVRRLQPIGIYFDPAGAPVEFRGIRRPFYMCSHHLARMPEQSREQVERIAELLGDETGTRAGNFRPSPAKSLAYAS